MTAGQLFQAGKLDQAVQALGAELRDNPGDVQRRTFLFELLCFAGAYDRAEKQLDVLAQGGKDAQLGALLYAGALHAERSRTEPFQKKEYPKPAGESAAAPLTGTLNGQPFESFADADPRIGVREGFERLPVERASERGRRRFPGRLRVLFFLKGFRPAPLGVQRAGVQQRSQLSVLAALRQDVELLLGPVVGSGKAQQFEQKRAALDVARVVPKLRAQRLHGLVELAGLKQLSGSHG